MGEKVDAHIGDHGLRVVVDLMPHHGTPTHVLLRQRVGKGQVAHHWYEEMSVAEGLSRILVRERRTTRILTILCLIQVVALLVLAANITFYGG